MVAVGRARPGEAAAVAARQSRGPDRGGGGRRRWFRRDGYRGRGAGQLQLRMGFAYLAVGPTAAFNGKPVSPPLVPA